MEKTDSPKDRRFRMEHASRVSPEGMPRFKTLAVIPSTQPAFCCGLPNTSAPNYAPGKSNQWNPYEKEGVTLVFSSDWPCSWPPSPLQGIQQGLCDRYASG